MDKERFYEEMRELVSAEDFFDYFDIPYDEDVVKVNRLHILQRFHNYLSATSMPNDLAIQRAIYINALSRAYADFVNSDAQTEKVMRIHQKMSGTSFVKIEKIGDQLGQSK